MRRLAVAVFTVVVLAHPAHAWEAATTHAGLAERSALSSSLHLRLVKQLGVKRGLFATLRVPPNDAAALFTLLRRMNPMHGYVPDGRGRLLALQWLIAGAVVADMPASRAANHYFDPVLRRGLSDASLARTPWFERLYRKVRRAGVPRRGIPAPQWLSHANNTMSIEGFVSQYRKAMSARTPGERERHLAGALLAAGALVHVLQDMGSPSHVRDDLAAHLTSVGNDELDLGSRFERIAALAYGRLGIPHVDKPVRATSLGDFFTNSSRTGLADITAASWFSHTTLPGSVGAPERGGNLVARVNKALRRPRPVGPSRIDIPAAKTPRGRRYANAQGVCLARYRIARDRLTWSMDDDCVLEQLAVILPMVVNYGAGFIDWLFRGALEVNADGENLSIRTSGVTAKDGTVVAYWDDDRGVRAQYAERKIEKNVSIPKPPATAIRVAVLLVGRDAAGQPLVASGTHELER